MATREASFDFEAFFHAHYQRIARAIARVIGDHARAEELAVEAFWKLWRSPRVQGENSGGWIYRTALRMALNELRRQALPAL
jgi:RNA polymerase sigma-70 factor (ECF subfamily)